MGPVTGRARRWHVPWLFLAPGLAVAAVFHLGPFANTVVLSFTDARAIGGGSFTGLANWTRLAGDERFWTAVGNTALYAAVVVPLLVALPLLLAVLVQPRLPGIGLFRSAFYTPVIASMVVAGLIWAWLLRSDGLVNYVLRTLRVVSEPVPFLTDPTLLLLSAMIVTVWKGLGYYMVIYLAALANVPRDLYEAAAVDGAGAARRLWSVTLPLLRPTMLLVGILSVIASGKVFAEVYVLSNGTAGPGGDARTMVFHIRDVGLGLSGEIGYASAMSLVLFVAMIAFTLGYLRLSRQAAQ